MLAPSSGATRAKRLLLLVDDCADNREMYAEFLGDEFDIAEAGTGAEALEKAFALLPDLVVMDLSLPGMGGEEATRNLKRDSRTRGMPVVIVSGQSEPTMQAPERWDAFLKKPCPPDELVATIRAALQR